jgi:hypothetical protein
MFMSWYRAPLWDLWADITSCRNVVWNLRCCFCGAPLWREDESAICSVITQWSESRRTRNHILLSHLRKKTQMETCRVWPRAKKAEKSSEAESFKHMKIKYTTHLKMAMWAETCSERQWTQHNKATRRRKQPAVPILCAQLAPVSLHNYNYSVHPVYWQCVLPLALLV